MLAFSGGGTRAAALAYGVLLELRDTPIEIGGQPGRLLDEVDLITSVSGGSFTSAYYALFGERTFEDFEKRFLKRNVQGQLIQELLNPANWFLLASTFFNRTELAIRYYDSEIFSGATFADLERPGAPFLHINATDLAIGGRFTFIQSQFDLLCSDLSRLDVARAVAASSAVPVLFPPVTLRNFSGSCDYRPPRWIDAALADRRHSPRRYYYAHDLSSYLDASRRGYIHLLDGGLVDNIGVRGPLENVMLVGGRHQRVDLIGGRPRHLVFIVVNAQTAPDHGLDLSAVSPSLASIINSVSDVQIRRYNIETLALLEATLSSWEAKAPLDPDGNPIRAHLVELSFENLEDPEQRYYFNNIATSFVLSDRSIDRLRDVGRALLRESPDFQELLKDLREPDGAAESEGPTP